MNGTAKKILFIEDEPIAKTVYGNRLQREGFTVSFAEDGEIALQKLTQEQPDLVVLDLMLPKVTGAEVLKFIRATEKLKETPVLILSNAYVTDLSEKAMESGATRGMLKTESTPAKLVEAVRDMLGLASAFDLSESPGSDDSQIEAFTAAAEKAMDDEITLKKTREEFLQKTPAEVAKIREYSLAYLKTAGTAAGRDPLASLHRQVRFFATRAGMCGCGSLALLASAFEALLFETVRKTEKATPSASQTIAQAVDCLERLFQNSNLESGDMALRAKILIVDDDAVCNFAMVAALKRAHFEAVSVADPSKALEMAAADIYDVLLLDINMPGISGFELCEKFRGLPEYSTTPIIFVTSSADFQSRARGILSGGNDLIPKPVSPVELVLKIALHLVQPHGAWAENAAVASVLKTTMRLLQAEARETQASAQGNAPRPGAKTERPAVASPPIAPIPFVATEPLIPATPADPAVIAEAQLASPVLQTLPAAKDHQPSTAPAATARIPFTVKEPLVAAPGEPAAPPVAVAEIPSGESAQPSHSAVTDHHSAPPTNAPLPFTVKNPLIPVAETEEAAPAVPPTAPPAEPNGAKPEVQPGEAQPAEELITPDRPGESAIEKPPAIEAELPKAEPSAILENLPPPPAPEPPNVIPLEPNSGLNRSTLIMETKTKPTFDEAARGVARIIFGDDNISDMNVRLTRIALERYNVPGTQSIDEISRGVARIIFGDDKISDMNVRLTRIALESYNITDGFGANGHKKPSENGVPHAVGSV